MQLPRKILAQGGRPFQHLLIGYWWSVLDQLVSMFNQHDKMQPHFLDNTDPAGFGGYFKVRASFK